MTSSAHDADLKGNNFRRTIHPQSFIVVAFIFWELDGGGASGAPPPVQKIAKKPGLDRVNKPEGCMLPLLFYGHASENQL